MSEGQDKKVGPVCKEQTMRTGPFCGRKVLIVGLTGGAASGKSTVAKMLADLGARVISADDMVHGLLDNDPEVQKEIIQAFGKDILNEQGRIDRRKLGKIVFKDAEKRARLEKIIHPRVLAQIESEINNFRKQCEGVLVVEIPLLIETSSVRMVDKVLVISAEQETQIERLQKRYGISRREALQRITAQLPMAEKIKHADWVISTEDTFEKTKEQVNSVWHAMQELLAQQK
ncbi:MAG: dephospho-CoA kinase [Armatimonadetes bacterium]|nr:dephospho-CoA kinase [Armatimonadota bacterium]